MARIIKISDARKKLATIREWTRTDRRRHGSRLLRDREKTTIIHFLADYQRRRMIKISEAFNSRNHPA